jgi:hypothetical protein
VGWEAPAGAVVGADSGELGNGGELKGNTMFETLFGIFIVCAFICILTPIAALVVGIVMFLAMLPVYGAAVVIDKVCSFFKRN